MQPDDKGKKLGVMIAIGAPKRTGPPSPPFGGGPDPGDQQPDPDESPSGSQEPTLSQVMDALNHLDVEIDHISKALGIQKGGPTLGAGGPQGDMYGGGPTPQGDGADQPYAPSGQSGQ